MAASGWTGALGAVTVFASGCAAVAPPAASTVPSTARASVSSPREETTTLQFATAEDLDAWQIRAGHWRVERGAAVGKQVGAEYSYMTWPVHYGAIASVTVRGGMVGPRGKEFRVAVGHVSAIFNWDMGNVNVMRNGCLGENVTPAALTADREHVIRFVQDGPLVRVTVDDNEIWQARTQMHGTVTIYPAVGSTIRIRSVEIRGVPIPWITVDGPSQPAP